MKRRVIIILSVVISLLFTSCIAEFLNEKFGLKVPVSGKENAEYFVYEYYFIDFNSSPQITSFTQKQEELPPVIVPKGTPYHPLEGYSNYLRINGIEHEYFSSEYHFESNDYANVWITEIHFYNPKVSYLNLISLLEALPDLGNKYTYELHITKDTSPVNSSWFQYGNSENNYGEKKRVYLDFTEASFSGFPSEAFKNQLWVKGVTFNINTGSETFMGCTNLEKVIMIDGVTSIGHDAFNGCTSLKEIIIPYGPAQISQRAFYNCTSLKTVSIPDSVSTIVSQAFEGCSSLEEITMSGSITEINERAFYNCTSLKTVSIPNSVSTIKSYAFEGCSSLEEIIIPNGTSAISQSIFKNCSSLKTVFIPSGVETIESEAFAGCSSLEEIYIPESVEIIQDKAFDGINTAILTVNYQGDEDDRVSLFTNCASDINNTTILAATWVPDQGFYW